MHEGRGPNYNINTGVFMLDKAYLAPQKRQYDTSGKITSEVALKVKGFGLIYIVMGDRDENSTQKWVVRVYYHPLVLWVFFGVLMIAGGGVVSFFDRKRMQVS
jgi:cytochrome c-type biogenesis protein CcmF